MKCEIVIWYLEVITDADSVYATEILINSAKLMEFDDVIIVKTMKT